MKQRTSINVDAKNKREIKRMRKNEFEKEERLHLKKALDAIRKFFGMPKKATKLETLTRLVDKSECFGIRAMCMTHRKLKHRGLQS